MGGGGAYLQDGSGMVNYTQHCRIRRQVLLPKMVIHTNLKNVGDLSTL